MSQQPREIPHQFLSAPFRGTDARRLGVTKDQLAGRHFQRIFHDVYVPAQLPDSPELRCAAALLVLPSNAVFCGVTAARLYGIPVPRRDKRIHVAVPSTMSTAPRPKDLTIHEYTIPEDQLGWHRGWQVIRPERLFLELAAALPRVDLIVAGDQLLRRTLTTTESLRRFLRRSHRRRGVRRARNALPLLEAAADSPPETRLRMLLVDAGLPRPVVNRDVVNSWGVWPARPDLSYPELKVAIQYEGSHHQRDYAQYSYDIERDGRLIDAGWIVIRVNKEGLFRHPDLTVKRIRGALSRRRSEIRQAA